MDLEPFRAGVGGDAADHARPGRAAARAHDGRLRRACSGVSAAGFAVLVNALPQVPARRTGLPVALVVRTALAAPNVGAATSFVHDAPHATGQHYLVAGAEQLGVVRVLARGCRSGAAGRRPACGTRTTRSSATWPSPTTPSPTRVGRPCAPRWRRRRGAVPAAARCSRPRRCAGRRRARTFAAIVIEQSARSTEVWVTDGPPTPDTWQHVPWS